MRYALLSVLLFVTTAAGAAIRWEPFELPAAATGLKAQIGHLTVPLDRKRPDAATVDLAFVRLQSASQKNGIPIVYLAGGPGQAATPSARNRYALPNLQRLAEIGDVILLDQRGTGQSTPRPVCAPEPLPPEQMFISREASFARAMAATRKCVAEWASKGVSASAFNNRENAADIEDLRVALGVPKLKLIGFSYGTHLALAYIRAYGPHVDRAVLIATAGPPHMRKLPLMLDAQLGKLTAGRAGSNDRRRCARYDRTRSRGSRSAPEESPSRDCPRSSGQEGCSDRD
jgi:pimeloyl-ACP methyl ester carboxylesterase